MNVRSIIFNILPEGNFKEIIGRIFFAYKNNLYAFNELIKNVNHLSNGVILLELSNGLKFYGNRNKLLPGSYGLTKQSNNFRYSTPEKIDKLREIDVDYYGDFCSILNEIFVSNVYEKYYQPKEGDVVVDCGANIGAFTVKAAKLVGKEGKVIAIEPDECNLRLLKKNLEINGIGNCEVVPKGVWNEKKRMKFYLGPASGWHSLVCERDNFIEREFTEIEVDTLYNILEELEIDKVDFIKMDIEGAEIEVLKEMEKYLKTNDVKLAIEGFHIVNGKHTYETIIPQLKNIGFKIHEEAGVVSTKRKIWSKSFSV